MMRHPRRYLPAAVVAAAGAYIVAIRPWQLHWGATDAEVAARMPGDDIVERPQVRITRAIDIAAPPRAVWPWLVQMGGYTRAGWYAYDHLDNAGRPSAEHLVPGLQHLAVGDVLPTSPDGQGFIVERIDPYRCLVLAIRDPRAVTSFACALHPTGPRHTRMVFRLRVRSRWTPGGLAYLAAMDTGDFVMMRRMMRGIRRRAERPHRDPRPPVTAPVSP